MTAYVLEPSPTHPDGWCLIGETGDQITMDASALLSVIGDSTSLVLVRNLGDVQALVADFPAAARDRLLDVHIVDRVLGTNLRTHPASQMSRFATADLAMADDLARRRILADHQLARLLIDRAQLGYLVDRQAMEEVISAAEQLRQELRQTLQRSGGKPFNPRSKTQLGTYLPALGAPPGTDLDTALAQLVDDPRPDVRDAAVLMTQFFRAEAEATKLRNLHHHLTDDDRVHPTVDIAGAITGRITYKAPALPNLAETMRHVVLAPPGQVLISADLNQIELRVAAALSQDHRLINDIASGDFHQRAAESIFRRSPTADDRAVAKQVVYAVLYGGGDDRLARTAGLDATGARTLRDNVLASYPDLARWAEDTMRSDRVVTQFGRLVRHQRGEAYKLVNHVIQATARDLFADMVLAAQSAGLEVWLPLHDEIIISASRPQAAESQKRLVEIMSATLGGVPITAKSRILGARWGARRDYAPSDSAAAVARHPNITSCRSAGPV